MSRINTEVLIAVLSLLGTCFGSLLGVFASNKLVNYRIEQLEKKVDKHNDILEKIPVLEYGLKKLNHAESEVVCVN